MHPKYKMLYNIQKSWITLSLRVISNNLSFFVLQTRVGAISFDDNVKIQFPLGLYSSKTDVIQALRFIKYSGGRTNIAGKQILHHLTRPHEIYSIWLGQHRQSNTNDIKIMGHKDLMKHLLKWCYFLCVGALKLLREQMFAPDLGARTGVPRIAIAFTDGTQTVDRYNLVEEATK